MLEQLQATYPFLTDDSLNKLAEYAARPIRRASLQETANGVVYFIAARALPRIKIGWTNSVGSVVRRLEELRGASPDRLEVIAIQPGSKLVEASLHARFRHLRTHREWFECGADLCDYIVSLPRVAWL